MPLVWYEKQKKIDSVPRPGWLHALFRALGVCIAIVLSASGAVAAASETSDGASGRLAHYYEKAQRVVRVSTSAELLQAIEGLQPGDLVVLADGTYNGSQPLRIFNRQGTSDAPIVIAAENTGGAVLTGTFHFDISYSSHITIDGLKFNTQPAGIRGEIGAITLRHTSYSRITRNEFALREIWGRNPNVMLDWVVIRGRGSQHNRVDHNLFREKMQRGRFLIIGLLDASDSMPQHTRVDHNHFYFMAPLCTNAMEAVVIGGGHPQSAHYMAHMDAHTIFEYNLLERVDGECAEIISLKSSSNVIRFNSIVETRGRIYFRAGDRNVVYGNYFIGNGKPGSGGVMLYGRDQKVLNNYFQGLAEPAVFIGDANAEEFDPQGKDLAPYTRVIRAEIALNTFVNNETAIARHRREGANLVGKEVVIADNVIISEGEGRPIDPALLSGEEITWRENVLFAPHSVQTMEIGTWDVGPGAIAATDLQLVPLEVGPYLIYVPNGREMPPGLLTPADVGPQAPEAE